MNLLGKMSFFQTKRIPDTYSVMVSRQFFFFFFHAGARRVQVRHKEELPACQGLLDMKVSRQRERMKFLSLQKKGKH